MNERDELVRRIDRALGRRSLVWFGIRGEDAAPYLAIPQFSTCFSVTAAPRTGALQEVAALEEMTGRRVDLDRYDIDLDDGGHVLEMRRRLLGALHRDSAVVTYRPSHFLSAAHFASHETCTYLGMFKDRQMAFEHKPWVETSLAKAGVRVIPWRYVADEHRSAIRRDLELGPCILRPSRTSGGEGITLVSRPEDLDVLWPVRGDHLVSVAPFLKGAIPVNVGGCVFSDGLLTLHPASVQLIGLPICTSWPFGYCGNDFAAIRDLAPSVLDEIAETTQRVGRWLLKQGYVGAFGVDYLIDGPTVYFTELNARLQGSSAPAALLSSQLGLSDVILDHLAAGLGVAPTTSRKLSEWMADLPDWSQVVVHNTHAHALTNTAGAFAIAPPAVRVDLAPDARIEVEAGGALARVSFDRQITSSGFEVSRRVHEAVGGLAQRLEVAQAKESGTVTT